MVQPRKYFDIPEKLMAGTLSIKTKRLYMQMVNQSKIELPMGLSNRLVPSLRTLCALQYEEYETIIVIGLQLALFCGDSTMVIVHYIDKLIGLNSV